MKTEDIVKYLLIAAGAYLVWEYVINPLITGTTGPATAPGTGTTGTTATNTNTGTQPVQQTQTQTQPSQPTLPPANTQPPVQSATNPNNPYTTTFNAIQAQATGVTSASPDDWAYYYQQIPGKVITATQMQQMLANQGITDRTQPISLGSFVNMLQGVGLSGLNAATMGGGNLRGGFSSRRPNAFGGSGGGSGRRLQTVH